MPISHQKNIYSVLSIVDDIEKRVGLSSILDIGTGFGKYGLLLRERMDVRFLRYNREDWKVRIDGIEPYADYITPVHKHVYNNLYSNKIEDLAEFIIPYDIIIMIDVLEHLDKKDGQEVVKFLWEKTNKALILSFPGSYQPREKTPWDNDLEIHRCLWTEDEISTLIGPVTHHKSTICVKLKV